VAEHGLDRLKVGAAGQGEGGSAVPEVVEPDRGQSLPAHEHGEPARQVPGRVGTAARLGEGVPVAPRGQLLPVAVRGEDLQGPGIQGQDPVAAMLLGGSSTSPRLVSCSCRLTVSVVPAKSMSHQRSPAASPRRSPDTAMS
jgi:hypothetical protein